MVNILRFKILSFIVLLETINGMSWFLTDVCWMTDCLFLANIFGVILLITGLLLSFAKKEIDSWALFFWMYMNFFWMIDKKEYAIICACIGSFLLFISLIKKHNIINFKRNK